MLITIRDFHMGAAGRSGPHQHEISIGFRIAMRDYIVLGIVFGSVLVILRYPYVGVLVWSWISYMNPHRLAYGVAYDFPVAALTGGTLLVALMFSKEPKRIPWTGLTIVWILLVVWMSFTTLFALVPDLAVEGWEKMIKIQLITFVTLILMRSRDRINWLIIVIVMSLGFYGVKGGIFTLLTGANYKVYGPPNSFIEDNNAMALALIMAIPLMRYLQLYATKMWMHVALIALTGLSVLSIVASYSRGALLAGVAMGLALVAKSPKRGRIILVLLISMPLLITFVPYKWIERMDTIGAYEQDASALGRINAWWFAFNLAKDRPFVGGGFDANSKEVFQRYAPDPDDYHDAHSIYFEMLGEHGFVGLALFLILGALALRTGTYVVRRANSDPELKWAKDLASMVRISVIGYAVGGTFLGLAYFDFYYHLVAVLVLLRSIVEERIAVKVASETREPPVAGAVVRQSVPSG